MRTRTRDHSWYTVNTNPHVYRNITNVNRQSHFLMSCCQGITIVDHFVQVVDVDELIHADMECRDYVDEAKSYQLSLAGLTPIQRPYNRMVPRRSCSGMYISIVFVCPFLCYCLRLLGLELYYRNVLAKFSRLKLVGIGFVSSLQSNWNLCALLFRSSGDVKPVTTWNVFARWVRIEGLLTMVDDIVFFYC